MAMTLRLTASESSALRRFAEDNDRSMQDVARQAIAVFIEDQSRAKDIDTAVDDLLRRYPDALKRLGE